MIVILLEELLYECLPEQGLAISASRRILSVPCQLVSCSSSCVPVPDDPFHLFLASLLFSPPLFISYGLGLCKYPIHTCPPSTRPPPLHPPAPSGLHRRSLHNLQLCLSSPATVPSIHHPSRAAPNISRHRGPATHLFPADPPGEAPTHSRRFSLVPSPCCRVVRPSIRHPSSVITYFSISIQDIHPGGGRGDRLGRLSEGYLSKAARRVDFV